MTNADASTPTITQLCSEGTNGRIWGGFQIPADKVCQEIAQDLAAEYGPIRKGGFGETVLTGVMGVAIESIEDRFWNCVAEHYGVE
jgi:hypothetical protein